MSVSDKIGLINNITTICLVFISLSASSFSILEDKKRASRIFGLILISDIVIEMAEMILVYRGVNHFTEISFVLNTLSLFVRMLLAAALLYNEYQESGSDRQTRRVQFLLVSNPLMVGCIFLFINIFTGVVFSVDSDGQLIRDDGLFIIYGIIFVYLFTTALTSMFEKGNGALYPFIPMPVLIIPIAIGVIIRIVLLPDVPVEILGGSISLLVYILSMSNSGRFFDTLTRVYNRDFLDYFFNRVKGERSFKVAGIMIGVNDLKKINDKYGHKAGDELILKVVNLIKDMEIKNSAFVRLSGNKFMLLVFVPDIKMIGDIVLNIKEKVFEPESESTSFYKISLSIGTTIYIPGEQAGSFMRRMYEQMYFEQKAQNEAYTH